MKCGKPRVPPGACQRPAFCGRSVSAVPRWRRHWFYHWPHRLAELEQLCDIMDPSTVITEHQRVSRESPIPWLSSGTRFPRRTREVRPNRHSGKDATNGEKSENLDEKNNGKSLPLLFLTLADIHVITRQRKWRKMNRIKSKNEKKVYSILTVHYNNGITNQICLFNNDFYWTLPFSVRHLHTFRLLFLIMYLKINLMFLYANMRAWSC